MSTVNKKDSETGGTSAKDQADHLAERSACMDRQESPDFEVGGGRPVVVRHEKKKFRPGDKVYVSVPGQSTAEGPYLISAPVSTGGYKICFESGVLARNGDVIQSENLIAA